MVSGHGSHGKSRKNDVQEHEGLSKPSSIAGRMQRLALAHLLEKDSRDEIPTSIRFVFYELEQAGHLSKRVLKLDGTEGKRKPTQDLTDALTKLRELGLIPWDWIVDESRDVHRSFAKPTVKDFLIGMTKVARIDRFPDVVRPVILCEARGVGGVLSRGVAGDYCVTVAPTGGQCNGFLRNEVAPYLEDDDTMVLYIGDHDLAGDDIEEHTRRVLEHATGRTFTEETWERLMLTDAQCRELQQKGVEPIQKKDNRFNDGRPHEAFEVEALGQTLVNQIVRTRLEELAPAPLADVLEHEEAERGRMAEILENLE